MKRRTAPSVLEAVRRRGCGRAACIRKADRLSTHHGSHLTLEKGETIILCRRNTPIAEIRAIPAAREKPRPLGLAKGTVRIPPSFFDPLPDDLLDLFEGKGD